MIKDSAYQLYGIDAFLNTTDTLSIPLIGIINIDNDIYGRLDLLINKYYNGNMQYLPLIMAFNRITDPIEVKLGMVFRLPDIDSIISQIEINDVLDNDFVPGINSSMDSAEINSNSVASSSNKTSALPKLNIVVNKVNYDPNSGILNF